MRLSFSTKTFWILPIVAAFLFQIKQRLRYFRAFDFVQSKNKSDVLRAMVKGNSAEISTLAFRHLEADFVKKK